MGRMPSMLGPDGSTYAATLILHQAAKSRCSFVSLVIHSMPAEGRHRLLHAAAEARQGWLPQASCTSSSLRRSASTTASTSSRPRAYTGRTTGPGSPRGRSEWWPLGAAPTSTPTPSRCALLRCSQNSACGTHRRVDSLEMKQHLHRVRSSGGEAPRRKVTLLVATGGVC